MQIYPGCGLGHNTASALLAHGLGSWRRRLMLWNPPRRPADFADSVPLWRLDARSIEGGDRITIALAGSQALEQVKIPSAKWSIGDFPNLDKNSEGAYIPVAFGYCFGVKATLVDSETGEFRVCGHGVRRFGRIWTDDGDAEADSFDLANGGFTWLDWDKSVSDPDNTNARTVYCDVEGIFGSPPDIIEYGVETVAGLTDALYKPVDGSDTYAGMGFGSFGCRGDWIIGKDLDNNDACRPEVSLFIREPITLRELVEKVSRAAFGWAFPEPDSGKLLYRRFLPLPSDGAMRLTGADIISVTPMSPIETLVTRVNVRYAMPADDTGDGRLYTVESDEARAAAGLPAHSDVEIKDVALGIERDAREFASRTLAIRSRAEREWTVEADLKAYPLNPGDGVTLLKTRPGPRGTTITEIDGYFMVLSNQLNPDGDTVTLTVTDWLGLTGEGGCFVMADAAAFPADLGGGDMTTWDPDWTAAQKRYAKENGGYYSDDNEFIDPDDAATWRRSQIL